MWMQDCPSCAAAKENGLHNWMRHLTENHVIPTEWPSERAAKLTGTLAVRPYTTITESKKKRRKDSIPRPLNSFMLFAQHIRRNVLRVFSDASNSAISQQLGDLWRTVPQNFRSQYDDEANRLVKIHQIEFPNYKYQPKKRQPIHTHTSTGLNSSNVVSVTGSSDITKSLHRAATRQGSLDSSSVTDQYSGTQHNESTVLKQRFSTSRNTTADIEFPNRFDHIKDEEKCPNIYNRHNSHAPTSIKLVSPAKLSPKTTYTTHITDQTPRIVSSNGILYTTKTTAQSLSSVLPPLVTQSTKLVTGSSTDLYVPNHQPGFCDSAYASGINSSSSSSASSPVVGELLSPTKPVSILGGLTKSSPVRRKLQLIPIRPQSQQPTNCTQVNRQRFLSANNGQQHQVGSKIHPLSNSHPGVNLVGDSSTTLYRLSSGGSNFESLDRTRRVHQLVAPVYVRLDAESSGTNEDMILTLPPGTTIIQTVGDLNNIAAQSKLTQTRCDQSGQPRLTQTVGPTSLDSASILTAHSLNVKGCCVKNEPVSNSDDFSPPPYTCSSDSPSAWSPLSGDVFLPLQQVHPSTVFEDDTNYTIRSSASCSYSVVSNTESGTYFYESEDSIMDNRLTSSNELLNELKVDSTNGIEDNINKIRCNVQADSPLVRVNENVNWTQSNGLESTQLVQNAKLSASENFTPLAISVAKLEQSSNEIMMDCDAPVSDFPMGTEDNFDASFDAMMNSFDITAFLPGTFSNSDDPIEDAFTIDNQVFKPEIKDCYYGDNTSNEEPKYIRQTTRSEGAQHEPLSNSLVDVDEMLTNLDQNQTVIIADDCCSAVPYPQDTSRRSGRRINNAPTNGVLVDIHPIYQMQMNSQHSPLSDLDALDKSSLLVIKPDWSVRV